MKTVTRTFHPLPFEHLEPKRFEDLVRQLTYDFRPWRQLEPTGRAGSDDGFDARGFEIVDFPVHPDEDDDRDEFVPSLSQDRLWLIRCKREKDIGPTRLLNYLDAIPESSILNLHSLIFAAACDFSKKTIDGFRAWCSAKGVQEAYLWGHATIEDFLYQPKNDHLLFAYFGISLQIRRQRLSSSIRRTVALKRKLSKALQSDGPETPLIIRDIDDKRYPYTDGKNLLEGRFLWLPCYSKGISNEGLRVVHRDHFAYYNYRRKQWDFASGVKFAYPPRDKNPWYDMQSNVERERLIDELRVFWLDLP